MNVLCLSPHLDDAVLSCGGTLHGLAAAGCEVTVATVFSAASGAEKERWQERQGEDRAALLHLRCRPLHMGLLDAPFRRANLSSFHSIVFAADPAEAGEARLVEDALRPLVAEARPDRLLCPLAVGRHIDHRLICAAVRGLRAQGALDDIALSFYEDRPYAFIPGAVSARLGELGEDGLTWALGALPFLAAYMEDEVDRARSLRALAAYLPRAAPPGAFLSHPLRLSPAARSARQAAIACYRSQLDALFAGDGDRIYATCGGDEEVLWTMT